MLFRSIHGYEHVRLVAADNIKSYDTEAADVFPGRNNVTSFTDYTQPSSYWNNNTSVSRPVLNIRQSGDLILFDYIQGTGIADNYLKPSTVKATIIDGKVFVDNPSQRKLIIYSASGEQMSNVFSEAYAEYKLPQGIYIVSVEGEESIKLCID